MDTLPMSHAGMPHSVGATAESLVAKTRLVITLLLLLVQIFVRLDDPLERIVGFVFTLAALAYALAVSSIVKRRYVPSFAHWTTVIDVTLVSGVLATHLGLGRPDVALTSRTAFEVYFLVIACSGLRYDHFLCSLTGGFAILQYSGLVWYAISALQTTWRTTNPDLAYYVPLFRVALLAAATLASAETARRSQRLWRHSVTDRLTGLLNRAGFDERLEEEASRASRHGHAMTIALLDVDRFKHFNDAHGHQAGDAALARLASLLRSTLRTSDVVARYGGEEFALILPETHAEDALRRLDQLRALVAAADVMQPLTVSIGVASSPADGKETRKVLAEADRRLYEAKRRGRDRVIGP